jgi:cytidine deaminase
MAEPAVARSDRGMSDSELIELAKKARAQAYAPYSRFAVGAALLATTGESLRRRER